VTKGREEFVDSTPLLFFRSMKEFVSVNPEVVRDFQKFLPLVYGQRMLRNFVF